MLAGHPLFHHEDVERPSLHTREYRVPSMRNGSDGPPRVSQDAGGDVAEVVVVTDEEYRGHLRCAGCYRKRSTGAFVGNSVRAGVHHCCVSVQR